MKLLDSRHTFRILTRANVYAVVILFAYDGQRIVSVLPIASGNVMTNRRL